MTAKKMKRPVVEKTFRLLIAIVFSIPVALAQSRSFSIQIESWLSEADARSSAARLRAQGLEAYWVKTTIAGMGVRYRVRVGRYPTQAQAKARADQFIGAGTTKEFLVTFYDTPASDSVAPDESKPATSAPNGAGLTSNKSGSSERKPPPESKIEPGPGGARPRKASNAEPAIATPAEAEATANVTIKNGDWRVVKHSAGIDKNLRSIYFVDSTTGWAAGETGMVYRTTDGGVNWEPLPSGYAGEIS